MVRRRHRSHDGLVSSLGVLDDQVAAQSAIRFRGIESDSGHGCIRRFLEGTDRDKGMDRVGVDWYRDRISRVVLARRYWGSHVHEAEPRPHRYAKRDPTDDRPSDASRLRPNFSLRLYRPALLWKRWIQES